MYIYFSSKLSCVIDEMYSHMLNQTKNPTLLRSELTLARVSHMNVMISRDRIIAGSGYIPLPKSISSKVATINPKDDDNACFMWADITALHNHEISFYPERVSKLKPNGNRYDWSDTSFPTDPRDILMAIGMTGVTYLFQQILEILISGKTKIASELMFLDEMHLSSSSRMRIQLIS